MKHLCRRKQLKTCILPETYQYFFSGSQIKFIWARIESYYGCIQRNAFNVMWVESSTLLLKAPRSGSPLTVLRKRHCTTADINKFHQLIEFVE